MTSAGNNPAVRARAWMTVVAGAVLLVVGLVLGGKDMRNSSDPTAATATAPEGRNRPAGEQSPYLLQHQDNPVDWHPWGAEAFELARRSDKPVFLSIGYSTCHWCHVMEHESFEDAEVARLLNDHFVCVKVDREERPDIDAVYMNVCQMLTGSGGWPLTIMMTAEKQPFFAATYIPKRSGFGRAGMVELIPRVATMWREQREDILQSAQGITAALQDVSRVQGRGELPDDILQQAYDGLAQRYDSTHGGFGAAPKFPTPHQLTFLLRHYHRSGEAQALTMVEHTLQQMRRGGIHDHVGFGFHRYATDQRWLVPHFEKMLYDQALLAVAYLETYQLTRDEQYADTAREIFSYVRRDLTDPLGGFYCAEDADSEGVEGLFYVWTPEQLHEVLSVEQAELATAVFGVTEAGNFKLEGHGDHRTVSILHLPRPLSETVATLELTKAELEGQLEVIRAKLFEARKQRIHPHKDDKILTDWNGLMIAALAYGGRVLDDPGTTQAAQRAAAFIREHLTDSDGRLLHRYRGGHAGIVGHLDDYAFLVWGLLELYQTTFETHYLHWAMDLTDKMIADFEDDGGGFYLTADHAEELLVRPKDAYDGALPAGNSVAMLNLLRLSHITGRTEWQGKAHALSRAFAESIEKVPIGFTHLLNAVDFATGPTHEIVIAGAAGRNDTAALLRALNERFLPNAVVLLRPDPPLPAKRGPAITDLAPYTAAQRAQGGATAYVCRDYRCHAPTTDHAEMLRLLDEARTKD